MLTYCNQKEGRKSSRPQCLDFGKTSEFAAMESCLCAIIFMLRAWRTALEFPKHFLVQGQSDVIRAGGSYSLSIMSFKEGTQMIRILSTRL